MTPLEPDDGPVPPPNEPTADAAPDTTSDVVVDDGPPAVDDPRVALETEREVLGAQLDDLETADDQRGFDDNFADSGQVAAEQGENRLLAAQLREQLDDVERAIAKLDDGTYGLCEVCQQPIGDARLNAMPAARLCMEHTS